VTHPESKGKYIKIILALLQSSSTAVVYECAGTLVTLSQAPTAIRAAANCYCQLLVSQSDNNVKLIVLVGVTGIGERRQRGGFGAARRVLRGSTRDSYLCSFQC
jgi:coatomer subunit beta